MLRAAVFAVALAACWSSPPVAPATPAAASRSMVELGEVTVFDGQTSEAFLKLHADGSTEIAGDTAGWQPGPRVGADGTISRDGVALVRLEADGTVTDLRSNAKLPIVFAGDRATVEGGKQVFVLQADGKVTVTPADDSREQPPSFRGASTPGLRRTALLLYLVASLP